MYKSLVNSREYGYTHIYVKSANEISEWKNKEQNGLEKLIKAQ